MKKDDAVLGMPVRFRRPMAHTYIAGSPYGITPRVAPRKEWKPSPYWKDDHWVNGVLIGFRTLSGGDYDFGGHEEQASLCNRTYFTAFLVVRDLRSNPVLVRPEDVEPLRAAVTPADWDGRRLEQP